MKSFDYSAQCENQAAISGTIEAVDADAAINQLAAMQLINIDLREAKRRPGRRSISSDDFIFFNEQLASLAETGIALDAGLRQLGKDIDSRPLRKVIDEIVEDTEKGIPLDQALERHSGRMPALYARVVRAGLKSGQLSATLLNLSRHLRMVSETRRLIVDALAYPCIVLCVACLIMGFILWYVVPQFVEIFREFDVALPSVTLAVIWFSNALPGVLVVAGAVLVAVFVMYVLSRASPPVRALRERLLFAVPLLGRLIQDSIRGRFCRAVAFSVNTGVPLQESLRLAADATASPAAAGEAERLADHVERGGSVFEACRGANLIPPMFGYVLEISADRNNVGEALGQLARSYELRAMHSQSLLRGWLAPLAVILVGVLIGFCILSLFMPFVQLTQALSGGC